MNPTENLKNPPPTPSEQLALNLKRSKTTKNLNLTPQKTLPLAFQNLKELGRYHIQNVLDGGGFGHIYKGYDPLLERHVAIKLSLNRLGEESPTHFKKEACILAQLNHSNVIQIYDFGLYENIPYIVMEFVEGENICSYLHNRYFYDKKQYIFQASRFFAQLVDALHTLHQKDIYHQDIKPENILICNRSQQLKLLDFGLAGSGSQEISEFIGTVHYAPPERFIPHYHPNTVSDIYSLGVVLYEVLTGRDAVLGTDSHQIIEKILAGKNDIYFKPQENIPEALQKICLKCVRQDPQKRYTSFAEVKTELEHFIATTTLINEYPYLYLLDKERSRILFPLTKERYYLGRSFGNDIVIQNPYISRVHAILEIFEHEVKITNYSRENPIQINQKALNYREFRLLSKNDFIQIVDYTFVYVPSKKGREQSLEKTNKYNAVGANVLSLNHAKKLLMMEEQELLKLLHSGDLKRIPSENSLLIEAESVYSYIERLSGNKGEMASELNTPNFSGIKLSVFHFGQPLDEFVFEENREFITIGRHSDCDVKIRDMGISRFHARLEKRNIIQYLLLDTDSSNGIYLKNKEAGFLEMDCPYFLQDGDEFYIGDYAFLFQISPLLLRKGRTDNIIIGGSTTQSFSIDYVKQELQTRVTIESMSAEKRRPQRPEQIETVLFEGKNVLPPQQNLESPENAKQKSSFLDSPDTWHETSLKAKVALSISSVSGTLRFLNEKGQEDSALLLKVATFFGAHPDCDFQLKGGGIPANQAVILKEPLGFRLVNLLHKKGVLVNGEEIQNSFLKDGDQLSLSKNDFKFYCDTDKIKKAYDSEQGIESPATEPTKSDSKLDRTRLM